MKARTGWLNIVLWCLAISYGAYVMMTLVLPVVKHEYNQWYVDQLDLVSTNELSSKISLHYIKGRNGCICAEEYTVKNHDAISVQVGDQLLFAVVWKGWASTQEMKLAMTNLQLVRGTAAMSCEPNSPFEGLEKMSYFEAESPGFVRQYLYTKDRWGFPAAVLVIDFNITDPPTAPLTKPEEADRSV